MSLRAIGAVVLLAAMGALWWWGYDTGRDRWQGKFDAEVQSHQQTREANAQVLRKIADLTEAARQERMREQSSYDAGTAANDRRHKQEMKHALDKKDAVIADLRSNQLQLQPWWEAGSGTCPGTSNAAANTGGQVDARDLRAEGAGALVQILAEADSDRAWYINELTQTRALCGAPPTAP